MTADLRKKARPVRDSEPVRTAAEPCPIEWCPASFSVAQSEVFREPVTRERRRLRRLHWLSLATLLTSCAVYDEHLLTGPSKVEENGGSSAETTGGSGGAMGTRSSRGGTSPIATSPRGGASATTSTSTTATQACQGDFLFGHCWYFGADGASCMQICAAHGGFDPATKDWVGTEAQGGSLDECATLLRLVGVTEAPTEGYRTDGRGLGCIDYEGTPFWHATPSFDPNDSMPGARLICACAQ
ncbi:MAG: hypothetical protein QM784_17180 [Polyangiaceae bacterium]